MKKGIVAYTLVANHITVNARVIGANEYESYYVLDLLFNNITEVQPTIHATDTHGSSPINFALLHFFGYQFALRYRDLYDKVRTSLYGFKHPSHYRTLALKPILKIQRSLWSECSRPITNCVIYYNATILSDLLRLKEQQGDARQVALLEHVSPVAWQHINFHGRFEFRSSPEQIYIAAMVQELARFPIQSIPVT